MKDSTRRRFEELQRGVEFLANLGIVVVVLVGAAVLSKQWQFSRISTGATRPSSAGSAPPVGKLLQVPGIDFGRSDQTLVLSLSTGCHSCAESGAFYQRLVSQARRNRRTVVAAVFPEDTAESDRFLTSLGVAVEKVITLPLSAVGTRGTPTDAASCVSEAVADGPGVGIRNQNCIEASEEATLELCGRAQCACLSSVFGVSCIGGAWSCSMRGAR